MQSTLATPTEEEQGLWRSFKTEGDLGAREALFSRYTPLAMRLTKQHIEKRRGSVEDIADLRQLAYAGLLEALDGFDHERGVSFARYAEARIRGSMLDGARQMSETPQQLSFRKRMRAERAKSLAVPSPEQLSPTEALEALANAAIGLALGFMLEDTTLFVADGAPDRRPSAYDSLAWKETIAQVAKAVSDLELRRQTVIRQHYLYGLDFDRLAKLLGVSKGRVSQLHRAALDDLRRRLGPDDNFTLIR